MRSVICCLLCLLICGLTISPALAGSVKDEKVPRKKMTQGRDNIFNYTNKELTGLLKDKTTKEVVYQFGLPDRISASVKKNQKIIYYKYGRTYTDKDKGVVFVNGKVKEVSVCK